MSDEDADRAQEILLFAINIEHIGDLAANSLLPLVMQRVGRVLSEFEQDCVLPLQAAIEESLHLAIGVFLREGRGAGVESGDLFQRLLRDYRRIHHHVTALAYPLLERQGSPGTIA